MAEGLLKKKLEEKQIKNIKVYSCGVFAETGDYASYEAIEALKRYQIDISRHRATNIKDAFIEEMDLILCATSSHKQAVLQMYPSLKGKVYTIEELSDYDLFTCGTGILQEWYRTKDAILRYYVGDNYAELAANWKRKERTGNE